MDLKSKYANLEIRHQEMDDSHMEHIAELNMQVVQQINETIRLENELADIHGPKDKIVRIQEEKDRLVD